MAIPKQVQKQSEAVQELYKELKEDEVQEAPVEETAESAPESEPSADNVTEIAAASSVEQSGERQEEKADWRQKYLTLQGMYNAEVPQLRQQVQEQTSKINQFEQLLSTMNQQQSQAPQQPAVEPTKLITDKEVEEYGESIDIMRKVSKEELGSMASEISNLRAQVAQMNQNTVPQVQQLANQVGNTQEQLFWAELENLVPDWDKINENADFQSWLLEVDPLSGQPRQAYLDDAQRRFDTKRVASFFQTWSSLKGSDSAQQVKTVNQNELEQQVSPKKGRSQGSVPTQKQTYSAADIGQFYDDVRKGKYKGRDDERAKIERDIFAAQAEGRIT